MPLTISLDQFLLDLRSVRAFKPSWSYAWVIGSGAAFTSGIPTGRLLAARWLGEIFAIRHPGSPKEQLTTWDAASDLGLAGLNVSDPSPFYGALYKLRFGHQPRLGQDFLRSQILGRAPSYGYGALAQIQTETPHQYAVTTNFDHLLEDAYKRFLDRDLIVCATDDQAATAQRLPDEPLVAKIHGDIFHETKSEANYIAELRDSWYDPLRTLFKRSAPLFVGYGGNDPGFMRFLTDMVRPGWFPHKAVWAYHDRAGPPTSELVRNFASQHDILFLPIPGFDEFMFLVSEALDLRPLTKRMEADFASRLRAYQKGYEAMASSLRAVRPEEARAGGALERSLAPPERRDWWEWREAAQNALTYQEGLAVLEEGVRRLPESPELRGYYAQYRARANQNDQEAEAIARRALEDAEKQYGLEHPGTLTCIRHLANILGHRQEFEPAESLLRRALDVSERTLGPEHPDTLKIVNNLAYVLFHKGDVVEAERLFRWDLATSERVLGPDHPETLMSVLSVSALMLSRRDFRNAETLARRAFDTSTRILGPSHPTTLSSATHLARILVAMDDQDGAESLFRSTLERMPQAMGADNPDRQLIEKELSTLVSQKKPRAATRSEKRGTNEVTNTAAKN